MAFPADLDGVVAADVTTLADAELVTVSVTGRVPADAGMVFPADPAGAFIVGVAPMAACWWNDISVRSCWGGRCRCG